MGQEYDRDEPPYAVQAGVLTQGWYLLQVDGNRPDMGFHVRLVTVQAESRRPSSWHIESPHETCEGPEYIKVCYHQSVINTEKVSEVQHRVGRRGSEVVDSKRSLPLS